MHGAPAALLLAGALAACGGDDVPAAAPTPAVRPATTAAAQTPAPRPPPPAPHARPPLAAQRADARLDGFGPLRLGMDISAAAQAWPGLFDSVPPAAGGACFHASPASLGLPYFSLMFDDGRFVRYDTSNDDLVAPGGGRRGMSEAVLQALYRNALQAAPHRFVKGGKYLSLDASGVAPARLVFETDAEGIVSEWRVGLRPQADYTEACESDPG